MVVLNLGLSDREVRLRLEAVARQAVLSPEIDAVVLFGSRARWDFRPDSDWDVALLARSDCEHPDVTAARKQIEEVDCYSDFQVWARTTGYLQTYADRSNLLAGAVATQGVPLAGKWPLTPAGLEGRQFMDLEGMCDQQIEVCEFIRDSWVAVARSSNKIQPRTRGLSYRSGMAAELLAKDIISSHSVHPAHTHDLLRLAEQLEGLPLEAWESEPQRRHVVETLRRMDGITLRPHLRIYSDGPDGPESLERCMQRVLLTMELQVSWLSRSASRGPDWKQAVRDAGREIVETAKYIQRLPTTSEQDMLDILPDQAVRAIAKWEARARRLSQSASSG